MNKSAFLIIILIYYIPLFAMQIDSVDPKTKIVQIKGKVKVNQEFFVYNEKKKKVGIVKITEIKNEIGIGSITKGTAKQGYLVKAKKEKSNKEESAFFIGLLAGMGMWKESIALTSETISLKGSSLSAALAIDYNFIPLIGIRATLGYDTLNVKGTSEAKLCEDLTSTNCSVNISFLTADFLARLRFLRGTVTAWAGGGFSYYSPLASKTTILDTSSISGQTVGLAALGADIFTSPTFAIPIEVRYVIFPDGDVKTSAILARLGAIVGF